jgi:hypothetical protein
MDLQDKSDYQEQGPKKGIVIIVITILLGTNGLLLWQFFDKKNRLDIANQQVMTTTAEKDALQMQLNQFKNEYEKLKSENAGLQNQLSERDEQIKAKVAEIQKLILLGGPAQIARAKAELAKLKEMNDMFVSQIDSLNKITAELKAQNLTLTSDLTQERSRNENLTAENSRLSSKVIAGSVLKAINIQVQGLRVKGNGAEVVTEKAKQIQKIKTTFTLSENKVIDRGPVDIFLRVIGPDGFVMTSNQQSIKVNGQDLQFTTKQVVDYNNTDTNVQVSWAKGSPFVKGSYSVEIYHTNALIGKASLDVK